MPKVTVINPVNRLELSNTEKKHRVCAYCRVSSDSSEQLQSFTAQVEHYTAMIQKNPQWQFCGVYADHGISGTDSSKREELQRLIRDCEAGKIDMVITKSISRLARNTADSIEIIRRLKLLGIGIYFEKENVNTLSAESELVLTILSSVAQEESISISQNNKWSCRKRFQSGEWVPSYLPYGYTLDDDENIVIEKSEAEVVRRIFNEYLNGRGTYLIAKGLKRITAEGYAGEQIADCNNRINELNEQSQVLHRLRSKGYLDSVLFIQKSNSIEGLFVSMPSYKAGNGFQKVLTREQLNTLAKLEWIDEMFNLVLIGPPGTGKTHIALAIGNKAVHEGYKVFFATMDTMMHILKTQEISMKSAARVRWINKCDHVIIDLISQLYWTG